MDELLRVEFSAVKHMARAVHGVFLTAAAGLATTALVTHGRRISQLLQHVCAFAISDMEAESRLSQLLVGAHLMERVHHECRRTLDANDVDFPMLVEIHALIAEVTNCRARFASARVSGATARPTTASQSAPAHRTDKGRDPRHQ